ncbi:hypothetical protein PRIPAC_89652 [Pristionchus pacificus]|nr:hypothetical protein PRIPAC_89652 [Pristionchus pacificus]
MTVSYTGDVGNANVQALGKLLWRWKGSIWKAVYVELFLWLFAYGLCSLVYHIYLDDLQKRYFEALCVFFAKYADLVPLTFMLGFYVSVVIARWWDMFDNIGWIDIPALYITNHIHGNDDHSRLIRRNLIRHLLFYQVMVYRDISIVIRERFPTLETCVTAGYLTVDELKKFRGIGSRFPQYWTPIAWVMSGLRRAYREGRIHSPQALQDLQDRVLAFRGNLGTLLGYDWVPIPLLYSQVVSLSVRIYFIIGLLGRQNLQQAVDNKYIDPINMYFPIMSTMQFIFYVGWLKVAEALLNPFGRDDDDLEINWLLDRNLEVGYMILEERDEIALTRDNFWSESVIYPLYSEDTVKQTHNPMVGSAVNMKLRTNSTVMVPRLIDDETEYMTRSNSIFSLAPLASLQRRLSRVGNGIGPEDSKDIESRRNSRKISCSNQNSVIHSPIPRPNSTATHNTGELHVVVEEDEDVEWKKKWFQLDPSSEEENDDKKDDRK